MKYRQIEGVDKPLSVLAYGTPWSAVSADHRKEAFRSYDLAWEAGFRVFDTAHSYGEGEDTLGRWLADRGHRQEAVILDKGCNPGQKGSPDVMSPETIRSQVHESLRRLRTDHVEWYLLHRDDESVPVDGIVEELNRLKREGKILRFGGSNWSHARLLAAENYAASHGLEGFTAVSPAYSLAGYMHDPWGGSIALSGKSQRAFRAWLRDKQIPVFCYSSLARGYLSGKYRTDRDASPEGVIAQAPIMEYDAPVNRGRLSRAEKLAKEKGLEVPQVCLAWLLHQDMLIFPLVAPSSPEHIRQTAGAVDVLLTDEECAWLLGEEEEG